jgi:hypothetical protein
MADFDRQESGRRGGQERQRRLRLERANDTATQIVEELRRLGLLQANLDDGELRRAAGVIVPLLKDVVKPASSRPKKQGANET